MIYLGLKKFAKARLGEVLYAKGLILSIFYLAKIGSLRGDSKRVLLDLLLDFSSIMCQPLSSTFLAELTETAMYQPLSVPGSRSVSGASPFSLP